MTGVRATSLFPVLFLAAFGCTNRAQIIKSEYTYKTDKTRIAQEQEEREKQKALALEDERKLASLSCPKRCRVLMKRCEARELEAFSKDETEVANRDSSMSWMHAGSDTRKQIHDSKMEACQARGVECLEMCE